MQYPNESPPDYAVNDPQPKPPKWRWWLRKRVWVPTLLAIVLVLFGIIFGAVFGVKQSQLEEAQRDRDRLLAAQQGSSSASWDHEYTSSRPYYGSPTTSTRPYWGPSTASDTYVSPTSPPSENDALILEDPGRVPKDISVAADAPKLLLWDLRTQGKLYKKEEGGSWEFYSERRFLFAPVSVKTGNGKQTAVSVDAVSGRIVYMHFHDGQWDDWQELEFAARFLRRPAVVARAQDRVDVVDIDDNGHMWIVSYDGSSWSEWTELGDSFSSDVSATTWGEDRIDVFAKNGDNVMHKSWNADSGWPADWLDLGNPFEGGWHDPDEWTGSPLAVSWHTGDDGVVDVFLTNGANRHRIFQHGQWSDWLPVGASHEGAEFPDTQSIVKGRGGRDAYAHMISRGTDNCLHYIAHNGTSWNMWEYLWCNRDEVDTELYWPTQYMPTSMVAPDNGDMQFVVDAQMVIKDLFGNVLRLQYAPAQEERKWSNDAWMHEGQPS